MLENNTTQMSSAIILPAIVKAKRSPSERQKKVAGALMVNGGKMKSAMLEAGYSPAYAKNSQKLRASGSFKDLLELISDNEIVDKIKEIALGEDKRACLVALDMLLKLKDRYPAGKLKIQEYQEELESLSG